MIDIATQQDQILSTYVAKLILNLKNMNNILA